MRSASAARPGAKPSPAIAVLVAIGLALLGAGCAGIPDRVEGRVHYRGPRSPKSEGRLLTIATPSARPPGSVTRAAGAGSGPPAGVAPDASRASVIISTDAELARLLQDLDAIGLFALSGKAQLPAEIPPGAIAIDTNARKFVVTLKDLGTDDEGKVFSRSAQRIVVATQDGPRYSLPK